MMVVTPFRKKKLARDAKIHADYTRLINLPGAQKVACEQMVMKKYKVSRTTIYTINKRFNPS